MVILLDWTHEVEGAKVVTFKNMGVFPIILVVSQMFILSNSKGIPTHQNMLELDYVCERYKGP